MSAPSQPARRGPSAIEPAIEAVEGARLLDGPAATLGTVARAASATPARKALLRGDWLGHAVHPVLSDVVVGTLLSASLLDFIGGDPDGRARRRLIAAAVAAATPTALTGLNDWAEKEESDGVAGRWPRTWRVAATRGRGGPGRGRLPGRPPVVRQGRRGRRGLSRSP